MNYNFNRMPYVYINQSNICNTNRDHRQKIFMNELNVNQETGIIELFVFRDRGQVPIRDAVVTIYARQTALVGATIRTVTTTANPIEIELPVAHPQGTLIRGPEYMFTTYNMTITAEGYSPVTILNIRVFPGIKEIFDINLIEVMPGQVPIPEKIIAIPPHPRDSINGMGFFD